MVTSATVVTIAFEIDALVITIVEAFGTLGEKTFTLGAIVTACAVFDSSPEFEASTGIENACFVLTGKIFCIGDAQPGVFLALVGRAVWYAFFVFAFFEITTNFPVFTLAPDSPVFTGLYALSANFCAFGSTSSAFA